jgi:peptidoglycan/xylan/chitin deacetylase (PgdA/CDA1 family)
VYDLKDKRWLKKIESFENKVVLTFDDGPSRHLLPILDILKEKSVPAVFFWQSRLFHHKRPWQRLLNEGHMIGSHAHKHVNLVKLNRDKQSEMIKLGKEILEKGTGQRVQFFRPPFGQYNEETMAILKELKLTPIMWEITSYDWQYKMNSEKIVENVVNLVGDGSIILLHELGQTVSILPKLIDGIRLKGYEFTQLILDDNAHDSTNQGHSFFKKMLCFWKINFLKKIELFLFFTNSVIVQYVIISINGKFYLFLSKFETEIY